MGQLIFIYMFEIRMIFWTCNSNINQELPIQVSFLGLKLDNIATKTVELESSVVGISLLAR